MPTTLNVLYAADDNYAPLLGVSLFSLFTNNKDIDNIVVYAILNSLSNNNLNKLKKMVEDFDRELIITDAKKFDQILEQRSVPKWRGSYAANYRLFFKDIIKNDVERFLYLDCDTIICGSLKPLINLEMNNNAAAVVRDCTVMNYYKQLVGFKKEEIYFNTGVMLFNVKNWDKNNCSQKLFDYIKNKRANYLYPDQDLLNILLKDNTLLLPLEYDFMPIHRLIDAKDYFDIFGKENYYTEEEIINAQKNPIVLHTYKFIGQFPWLKNTWHPDNKIVDYYLEKSPWKGYNKKRDFSLSLFIKNVLHFVLPKKMFFKMFAYFAYKDLEKREKEIKISLNT